MLYNDYEQFLYAKKLYKERKYDAALTIFERLQNRYSEDTSVKFEYARALIKTGAHISYGETILYYFINTYRGEKSEIASLELARLEIERRNLAKAENYLKPLLKCQNSDRAMFELARVAELKGDYKLAINYLKQLISLNYDLSIIFLSLISIYYKIGLYDEAYDCLNYVIDNNITLRITDKEFLKLDSLLRYKVGLISGEEAIESTDSYFLSQAVCYNKEEAIKRVSRHQDTRSLDKNYIHTRIGRGVPFLKDIDIAELYEYCALKIKDASIHDFDTADEYIVRFDKPIARVNFEYVYTVSVITLSNTKDILTIYPNARAEKLLLRRETGKKKIKK